MVLILRTMDYLGMSATDVEFITSSITTWAPKINMIIASIAMGMSTSLIPTMVSAYTLNNWKEVNNKFNQALQIIFFISLPMTIGISMLATSIWSIFYGYNMNGTYILALNVFTGLFINVFGWELSPMFGAAAMSLSSFCVVSNALRLNFKDIHNSKKDKKIKFKYKEKKVMEITMKIEGMMCPHCSGRVKMVLEALEGVAAADVSHETGKAIVTLEADVANEVLADTVAALSSNSISWVSNGIEYYLVSDVMSQIELVEIASSITKIEYNK